MPYGQNTKSVQYLSNGTTGRFLALCRRIHWRDQINTQMTPFTSEGSMYDNQEQLNVKGGSTMSDRQNLLSMIKKDMKVYDIEGHEVGMVEFVHFSEAHGSRSTGAASLPDEPAKSDLIEIIKEMFGSDGLPEELRERLLMRGFFKIDSAKLFGADRYAMSDQIAKVDDNGVHLKVKDSEKLIMG
jgi:hypothetical protein